MPWSSRVPAPLLETSLIEAPNKPAGRMVASLGDKVHQYKATIFLHPQRHKPQEGAWQVWPTTQRKRPVTWDPELKKSSLKALQEGFYFEPNYQLKRHLPAQRPSLHEFPGLLIKMSLQTANNCGNWHQFLEGFVKIIIPEPCLTLFPDIFYYAHILLPFLEVIIYHFKGGFERRK